MQVGEVGEQYSATAPSALQEQEYNLHWLSVLPHAAGRKKKKKIKIEKWRELAANFHTNMK